MRLPCFHHRVTSWVLCGAVWLAGCASVEAPWPERVVAFEQMRLLTPLRTLVLTRESDRTRVSTVVLQVFVTADGSVLRSRIEQSSGNPRLDEAALHTMRSARFVPHRVDGVAVPVTLLAPMHYPFQEKRP